MILLGRAYLAKSKVGYMRHFCVLSMLFCNQLKEAWVFISVVLYSIVGIGDVNHMNVDLVWFCIKLAMFADNNC